MPDLAQDRRGLGGPDERLGITVVETHVLADRRVQVRHAGEGAASDTLARDLCEPALHQIEPRCTGRREVKMVARMLREPLLELLYRNSQFHRSAEQLSAQFHFCQFLNVFQDLTLNCHSFYSILEYLQETKSILCTVHYLSQLDRPVPLFLSNISLLST